MKIKMENDACNGCPKRGDCSILDAIDDLESSIAHVPVTITVKIDDCNYKNEDD